MQHRSSKIKGSSKQKNAIFFYSKNCRKLFFNDNNDNIAPKSTSLGAQEGIFVTKIR